MKIIEVDGVKYQVIKEFDGSSGEFIDKLSEFYKDRYSDFTLIKKTPSVGMSTGPPPHLICRRIDDADYDEINDAGVIEG